MKLTVKLAEPPVEAFVLELTPREAGNLRVVLGRATTGLMGPINDVNGIAEDLYSALRDAGAEYRSTW